MSAALITGTSSGIGQATALHLARQGYWVFASMRDPATGAAPLTEAARQEGLKLTVIELDVTDAGSSERAVQKVLGQAGRLDALINNAGIGGGGPLEEVSEDLLRQIFETNFFGPMRLMRLVVPTMRQARGGAIVNVTSIMGRLARAGASAYAGSKFALEAASEALAQEVRRFDIRVAIIEPGVVQTPLHEKEGGRPDPNSPYHEFTLRGSRLFGALLENPSSPELVAATIQHALETDQPKLRYLVGKDAHKWAAGRQAMSDEAWVDVGRKMTLDEYAAFYRDRFGMAI
jgi:NAD(P)-dependent dehydrogenase (short-subunit alcohol dehydrogenase family)